MLTSLRNRVRRKSSRLRSGVRQYKHRVFSPEDAARYVRVLSYHGIEERPARDWGPRRYSVDPDAFAHQVARFDRDHEVVPLSTAVAWLRGKASLADGSVVLTFDDGYRNFLETALPILEDRDLPATLFVSLSFLDGSIPFEYALANKLETATEVDVQVDTLAIDESLSSDDDRARVYRRLEAFGKYSRPAIRREILEQLPPSERSAVEMLSASDVRELRDHPLVSVECHGLDHVPLTILSRASQRENVRAARRRFKEVVGGDARYFCFPYGDWDESLIRQVRDAGFHAALTTVPREVRRWHSLYRIGRLDGSTLDGPAD